MRNETDRTDRVIMTDSLRVMRECRKLCGLDYSVGATKRAVYAETELTPHEINTFRKELFNQIGKES